MESHRKKFKSPRQILVNLVTERPIGVLLRRTLAHQRSLDLVFLFVEADKISGKKSALRWKVSSVGLEWAYLRSLHHRRIAFSYSGLLNQRHDCVESDLCEHFGAVTGSALECSTANTTHIVSDGRMDSEQIDHPRDHSRKQACGRTPTTSKRPRRFTLKDVVKKYLARRNLANVMVCLRVAAAERAKRARSGAQIRSKNEVSRSFLTYWPLSEPRSLSATLSTKTSTML